jgi:hypothetical protein
VSPYANIFLSMPGGGVERQHPGGTLVAGSPDPAAIRYEVLSRVLRGREGWSSTGETWRLGEFELVPKASPGLPYELWRNKRCIAALMVPKDAVAVAECLDGAAREVPSSPERLFRALSIPVPNTAL